MSIAPFALLLTLVSATAFSASPPASRSQFLYGDANGDDAITVNDALLALESALGLTPLNLRADIAPLHSDGSRGDGDVKLNDAISILRTLGGSEPQHLVKLSLSAGADDIATAAIVIPPPYSFSLKVSNPGTDAVRLEYLSDPQSDFVVYKDGVEVWRESVHATVLEGASSLTIQPGETKSFAATWNGKDDSGKSVATGLYQLQAELPTANGGVLRSDAISIQVTQTTVKGGLVAVVTTDLTDYASGQPVNITVTETNQSDSDAQVYIGCSSFYDIWIDYGDVKVWDLNRNPTCLAIGFMTLHPGESRKLTTIWNGNFNVTALPLPSGPATFQANAVINETSGAVNATPTSFTVGTATADDFPLAIGDTWTYDHQNFGDAGATGTQTQTVTGDTVANGETWYVLDNYIDGDKTMLREANNAVLEKTTAGETTRYQLDAKEGDQWSYLPDGATRAYTATMVSRNASLVTPFGTLSHLLEIAFLEGVDTSETDYLAPGVGLVGVDHRVNVTTTPSLRLDYYQFTKGTGIQGVAMRGPTMPVCPTGNSCEEPYPGAIITVQPAGGGAEIARVTTDSQGKFEIAMSPGTYKIVPLNANGDNGFPKGNPQTVTVPESGFAQVTVTYDTGIR